MQIKKQNVQAPQTSTYVLSILSSNTLVLPDFEL